ncbi:P2X receptor [Pelomyxa schiedti]|nr:P2X receptor [Pelomyxa schiedti]
MVKSLSSICSSMWVAFKNFLAYDTVQVVRIKDTKLAVVHWSFVILIVLYIALWTILKGKAYLLLQTPDGSVRMSLLKPGTYAPAEELPYCLQNSSYYNGYPNWECAYLDQVLALYPPGEPNGMAISTRITSTSQYLPSCNLTELNCDYVDNVTTTYYLADIEKFTVLLDHSFYAPEVGIQGNGRDIIGEIVDSKGHVMKLQSPNVVGQGGSYDILQLGVILQAAGIDLDSTSDTNTSVSKRFDGIVIMIMISYSNTYTYNLNKIKYTVSCQAISGAKYKVEQPYVDQNLQARLVHNRHGVHLVALQMGALGKFDFQTLLITFVSGFGLVAFATVVVDILATKILPNRQIYAGLKYKKTCDFAELSDDELTGLLSRVQQINNMKVTPTTAPTSSLFQSQQP